MKNHQLLSKTTIPETVILANGEYPNAELPLALLWNAKFVICCDGAANAYVANGLVPDVIIGDGDSLSADLKERYADIFQVINEQESNDQTKAFSYCVAHGRKDILILGATGSRDDHMLGNISLLMDYQKQAFVRMVTNYGEFIPAMGDMKFETRTGQQISIFNFGCSRMRAKGLVYPVRPFTNWWQGTLNETIGDSFCIEADGDYLVYCAY